MAKKLRRSAERKLAKMDTEARDAVVKLAKDEMAFQAQADKLVDDLNRHFRKKQIEIETRSLGAAGTIIYWCLHNYFGWEQDAFSKLTQYVKDIVSCFKNSGSENSFVGLTLKDLIDNLRDEKQIEMVGVDGVLPYILGGQPLIIEMLEKQIEDGEKPAPTVPVKEAEPAESVAAAEPVKPAEPAEPIAAAEPVKPAEPAEATESKTRKCAFCGSKFTPNTPRRIYCSDRCRVNSSVKRRKEKAAASGANTDDGNPKKATVIIPRKGAKKQL